MEPVGNPRPVRASGFRIFAGIPARYDSMRFPGKPLALLCGHPMIEHVYRRVAQVPDVEEVIVATDDARIVAAVEAFGGRAELTRCGHGSGTERLAELFAKIDCDLVVNVQGDEPLIDPRAIAQAIEPFFADRTMAVATLKTRILDPETLASPHVVKVSTDTAGFAVNFSRQAISRAEGTEGSADRRTEEHFKHLGLYVYRRDLLLRFPHLPPSSREQAEHLEQLRLLEHGIPIQVVETPYDSIGVDTPEDLARAEAVLKSDPATLRSRMPATAGSRDSGQTSDPPTPDAQAPWRV